MRFLATIQIILLQIVAVFAFKIAVCAYRFDKYLKLSRNMAHSLCYSVLLCESLCQFLFYWLPEYFRVPILLNSPFLIQADPFLSSTRPENNYLSGFRYY